MTPTDSSKTPKKKNPAAVAMGKLGGPKGGPARAAALTPERRREIAQMGAAARIANFKKKRKKLKPNL